MARVFACVTEQHNLWLVLVAAAICVSAAAAMFFVLDASRGTERATRQRWLFLAAVLAGGGTWATHFVAMLGYNPGVPIAFNLAPTLVSAALCTMGAWFALTILERAPDGLGRVGAGVMLGAAVAAMHYSGMAGLEAAAQRVWAPDLVFASFLFSAGFAIAALHAFAVAPPRWRALAGAGLLVVAIVSLHFTGMGALTLVPDPRIAPPSGALDASLMAATVAIGAAGVLLVGVLLAMADRRVAAVELKAARHAAAMARHDSLTGLPNRAHLREELEHRLQRLKREEKLAIVAVDLDRFKPVNDLYGHAVGDELLVKIANILSTEAGKNGFAARLGGDEFILIVPYDSFEVLIERMSELVARFDAPIRLAEHEPSVGATLGIALAPQDGLDPDQLMRRADVALYRGKDEGRGRFAFFEAGMDRMVHERAALEHDLRTAVRNNDIVPYFQPLVDLRSHHIAGYEILARWKHPQRGNVPPTIFIRIAEQTGLIGELTFNLLEAACREALTWAGGPLLSLNIAPVQLQDGALPQKILRVLSECGFPPARLQIEITENALVADLDAARTVLASLKNLGVRIALDDFGTGYSSLRHLRELPFDSLKIDRSFVHGMTDSAESLTIVRTVVQLAKSLGLGVTAEGIETAEQADELKALGCEHGQGFLLGRPSPNPDVAVEPASGASAA